MASQSTDLWDQAEHPETIPPPAPARFCGRYVVTVRAVALVKGKGQVPVEELPGYAGRAFPQVTLTVWDILRPPTEPPVQRKLLAIDDGWTKLVLPAFVALGRQARDFDAYVECELIPTGRDWKHAQSGKTVHETMPVPLRIFANQYDCFQAARMLENGPVGVTPGSGPVQEPAPPASVPAPAQPVASVPYPAKHFPLPNGQWVVLWPDGRSKVCADEADAQAEAAFGRP